MSDFKTALSRFLIGEIELPELEAALARELVARPDAASELNTQLETLYRTNRLQHQIFAVLKRQVLAGPQAPEAGAPARDERTRFRLPDQQPAGDAGDRTVMKPPGGTARTGSSQWPAAPSTDHGQTSPSSWSQSRPAPQTRGSTSGSAGSSWASPSQWTGGSPAGEPDSAPPQVGSIVKGRFVLEQLIGQGGMGVVYKARDLRQEEAQERNPYVALKLLNEDFKRHPESLKALQRESRKAQDLAHPNVVSVYTFDRDGTNVFMVMELLDGEPLDRLIKRNAGKGLPEKQALEIIESLVAGLAYAHKKGIVHSDFKPSNAYLTRDGAVKVFDFGIARAAKLRGDGEKTLFDAGTLGAMTPAYASLEMIEGQEPDTRDDVYALACVAYELLTGRHPFDKRSAAEARKAGMVPAAVRGLSRRQNQGLRRGLAFLRKDRSPTVEVLLQDLRPLRVEKSMILAGVLGTAVLAAALAFVILWWLPKREVDALAAIIQEGPAERIAQSVGAIRALDENQRQTLLGVPAVREAFVDYYRAQVNAAVDAARQRYGYGEAARLITELKGFPEIPADSVSRIEANTISRFDDDLKAALAAGVLIRRQGASNALDIATAMNAITPSQTRVANLVPDLSQQARAAADSEELDLALELVDSGLKIAEGNASLRNLGDELRARQVASRSAALVAEAERALSARLPDLNALAAFSAAEAPMTTLIAAAPQSPVLQAAQERLETQVQAALASSQAERDFDAGTALLDRYAPLLPARFVEDQAAVVSNARREYTEQFNALVTRFRKAIDDGRLESPQPGNAEDGLAALISAGAPAVAISEARRTLAGAYLFKAEAARNAGQWDEALRLVERGLGQQPDPALQTRLNDEIKAVEAARNTAITMGQKEQERLAREERERAVRELTATFESTLRKPDFRIADANALADVLKQVAAKSGDVPDGRNRIVNRLVARADEIRGADSYDAAIEFARLGLALFPATPALQAKVAALGQERDARLALSRDQQIKSSRDRLAQLLQTPAVGDARWDGEVRTAQQALEKSLGTGHAEVGASSARIAGVYLREARAQRSRQNLFKAESALALAQSFAPALAGLAAEAAALNRDKVAQAARDEEARSAADINRLKDTLRLKAAAKAPADASAALAELRKLLPAGDPFLVKDGPRAIADSYVALGKEAAGSKRWDAAAQLAGKALAQLPAYRPALDLQADIARQRAQSVAAVTAPPGTAVPPPGQPGASTPAPTPGAARVPEARPQEPAPAAPVVASTRPPARAESGADPCARAGLAGAGAKARAICFDEFDEQKGPQLVVVPPDSATGGKPLAITRYEITVQQYSSYCQASGACQPVAGTKGTLPVTGISVRDAEGMGRWLSSKTGREYRLPTASEWLYAARADGGALSPNVNCRGSTATRAGRGFELLEVNTDVPNGWGLFNHVGNAREWVRTGSTLEVRGGAFEDSRAECSIQLSVSHDGQPDKLTGFRLVRAIGG